MATHINSPNTKFLRSSGISVKGIQNTAKSTSLMDRFNRKTFVMVRIRRFWSNVKITKIFPTTDKRKIITYSGIRISPLASKRI